MKKADGRRQKLTCVSAGADSVAPTHPDEISYLDRCINLLNLDFPIEFGIDTVKVRIPVNAGGPLSWHMTTAYRKNGQLYGKGSKAAHEASGGQTFEQVSIYYAWQHGRAYDVECSIPKLLGLPAAALGKEQDLREAISLIEGLVNNIAYPNHLIPPPCAWSFTRADFAFQVATTQTDRLADYWVACDPAGDYSWFDGSHSSAFRHGATYQVRLYDKLKEQGVPSWDGRTLMRCEISTDRNGLIRKAAPYNHDLEGIASLITNDLPKLLSPEIKHLCRAIHFLDQEEEFPEILNLCKGRQERLAVELLLRSYPRYSMRESLREIKKGVLAPEVRAKLRKIAKRECREFRCRRTGPCLW